MNKPKRLLDINKIVSNIKESIKIKDHAFIEDLNLSLERSNAFSYNDFLSRKISPDVKIIDAIKLLEKELKPLPEKEQSINLSLSDQIQTVIDFFYNIDVSLGEQVENIFSNNQEIYNVRFIKDLNDKDYKKYEVRVNPENMKMDFTITAAKNLDSLMAMAHECTHAISKRNLTWLQLIKNALTSGNKMDEYSYFKYADFRNSNAADCTNEIESTIIELLFLDYLKQTKVITEFQHTNYINFKYNTFLKMLNLISEEFDVVSNLTYPVTKENYKEFKKKIKNYPNAEKLLERAEFIAERENNPNKIFYFSKHMFRYVVAEIVSFIWYNRFKVCSKQEKREMLKTYTEYLNNTHIADLQNVFDDLLSMSIFDAGVKYFNYKTKSNSKNI